MEFDQIKTLKVDKYRAFMNKMFNKSFLNEGKKLEKTVKAMQR
jgi:hypothetical protein